MKRFSNFSHTYRAQARGFSLVEMAIVIAVIGVLAGAAVFAVDVESGAATVVDTEQGTLAAVVKQGAAITGNAPNSAAVVTGAQNYLADQVLTGGSGATAWTCNTGAGTCTITLEGAKTATYAIAANGVVTLTNLTGFNHYAISASDRIEKT